MHSQRLLTLLTLSARPAAALLRMCNRAMQPWRRIYYTLSLMARVRDMNVSVQCDGPVSVSGSGHISIGSL